MLHSANGASRRPGRGPVLLSVALHVAILVAMTVGNLLTGEEIEYVTFEMQMISEAELEALLDPPPMPVAESQPEPEPPEPEPEPEPAPPEPEPEPEPEPAPPEPEPEPEPAPPEPEPEPEPAPTPDPAPTPPAAPAVEVEASTENMAVRMEGLRRDFPAYYAQILREVDRCFRWTAGGRWDVVLRFEIQRDGRIPGRTIQIYQRSGNSTFDIDAFGAVECAGRRLEPLPDDLPGDHLAIQLRLTPR